LKLPKASEDAAQMRKELDALETALGLSLDTTLGATLDKLRKDIDAEVKTTAGEIKTLEGEIAGLKNDLAKLPTSAAVEALKTSLDNMQKKLVDPAKFDSALADIGKLRGDLDALTSSLSRVVAKLACTADELTDILTSTPSRAREMAPHKAGTQEENRGQIAKGRWSDPPAFFLNDLNFNLDDENRRLRGHAVIKIDDVLIDQAHAAGRYGLAD
jgi:peptidoglycan hydrolase CwlO-like protein